MEAGAGDGGQSETESGQVQGSDDTGMRLTLDQRSDQ